MIRVLGFTLSADLSGSSSTCRPSASFLLALLDFQSAVLKSWGALKISADFRLLIVVLLLSVLCEFCTNVFGRADKGETGE